MANYFPQCNLWKLLTFLLCFECNPNNLWGKPSGHLRTHLECNWSFVNVREGWKFSIGYLPKPFPTSTIEWTNFWRILQYVKVSWFRYVFLVSSLSSKKRTKTSWQVVKSNLLVLFWKERRLEKIISNLSDLYQIAKEINDKNVAV